MIKNIYDVIKDIFKTVSDVGLDDITWEELKDYVVQQNVFHTEMFENADGYGIDPKDPNVETIHGIFNDGENEYSEVIFRKDGTAHIVETNEVFIWNQQLYEGCEPKNRGWKFSNIKNAKCIKEHLNRVEEYHKNK